MDTWSKQTQFKPNQPNFQKAQMNVNSLITKDYRKKDDFAVRKNKPNSKPISSKVKMNANAFSQKDYENETTLRPQKDKPNQTQFQNTTPKEREEKKVSRKLLNKFKFFHKSKKSFHIRQIFV